jgi:hypothetical protein
MARRKLTPSEIVERLQVIDALTEDGQSLVDAMRLVGMLPSEYLQWRLEYAGVLRTLGPLSDASWDMIRRPSAGPVRGRRTNRLLN